MISIIDQQIYTELYCKPTDAHNYFMYSSAHPQNVGTVSVFHIRRIRSRRADFDKHMKSMVINFMDRSYPIYLLERSALKARRTNRHDLFHCTQSDSKTKNDKSILVTKFHPEDNSVKQIVNHNWRLLGKSHSHSALSESNHKHLVAYRRPLS